MTKNEAFKITGCRCRPTKRYLFKALKIFYPVSEIEHNEEYGFFKVSLHFLVGKSDFVLNLFGNLCREFACHDEVDNGYVKLFYNDKYE